MVCLPLWGRTRGCASPESLSHLSRRAQPLSRRTRARFHVFWAEWTDSLGQGWDRERSLSSFARRQSRCSSKVVAASFPRSLDARGLAPVMSLRSRHTVLSPLVFTMLAPSAVSFSPSRHGM